MGWVVRAFLIIGGLIAFGLSHLVEPLYRAQPQILLSAPALLLPPRGLQTSIVLVLVLSALWMGESLFYRRVLGLEWRVAFRETVRTYTPLVLLLIYVPVLVPGRAPLPFIGWWLVVDARAWIATLVVACAIYLKVTFLAPFLDAHRDRWRRVSGSRLAFLGLVLGLLATLLASIPERRFTQPYDERWGTGDEPRYVRITASLLHDGDADVGNAEELIEKRPDPARALTHVAAWIPATIGTAYEAAKSIFGIEPRGRVEWIGGPVLEGRKGGTFYVFLPGLPFLLTPSMAVDTFVNPDRLVFTLFTCLLLGTFCTLAIARLVEPAIGSRLGGVGLAFAIGVTPPLFFYHFHVYTEVTATICITLMLIAVLSTRLTLRWAIAFGLSGALLPWLHTKYLPIWGVLLLAYCWKGFRSKAGWKLFGWALTLSCLGMGLQCLYVFHITGSLLPDALWVARGYPRGATFLNQKTLPGLYYLLLDRAEGLLVYSPLYLFALPGAWALRRQSPFAFGLGLVIVVPYLFTAASHDQGGLGAWAPPARYLVPLVPVMALCLAAWLRDPEMRRLRWTALAFVAAAGFWIGQGMLTERHFVYDRSAFLASGVVDPSPVLGSVGTAQSVWQRGAYPVFLVLVFGLVWMWEGRGWRAQPTVLAAAVVAMVVAVGSLASAWSQPRDWIRGRPATGAARIRSPRPLYVALPDCGTRAPRLRFHGTGGSHGVTVSGPGLERELKVPSSSTAELDVSVEPIRTVGRGDRRAIAVVRIALHRGENPVDVEAFCR